jgi:Di-haem oxidoreductase, putative peroxidase
VQKEKAVGPQPPIEAISDSAILSNKASNLESKRALGINGHENRNSGGPVGRFGWKAQHHSVLLFTAEAYNVEMGVTNELFPIERDETEGCGFNKPQKTVPSRMVSISDRFWIRLSTRPRSPVISSSLPHTCGCWRRQHQRQ